MDNNMEMPSFNLEYLKDNNNITDLKAYKEQYEGQSTHTPEQDEMYKEVSSRLEQLEQKELKDVLLEGQKENNSLENFQIITIHKEQKAVNDRDIYNTNIDSNYLKLDDKVFEIENQNIDKVKAILSDKDKAKDLGQQEILNLLSPYLTNVDEKTLVIGEETTSEMINKQVDDIDNDYLKQTAIKNMPEILNEKDKITEYVKKNNLEDLNVKMTVNSRGERLYLVGDNAIKFLGDNKEMHIYKKNGEEVIYNSLNNNNNIDNIAREVDINSINQNTGERHDVSINSQNSNIDIQNNNEDNNLNNSQYDIEYFAKNITFLNAIANKIYSRIALEQNEVVFFKMFIDVYQNSEKQGLYIDEDLKDFYYRFGNEIKKENYNVPEISSMISDQEIKENLEDKNELEKKNDDVKKYVLTNPNVDKGFVNIIYIVLLILVSSLIFVYLLFVNK